VLLAPLLAVAACSLSTTANPDGWWDVGVEAIDGYWVVPGGPCDPATDAMCGMAVDAAIATVQAREPGAPIVAVTTARYPAQREPDQVTFTYAGWQHPRFLILDLADGTRRVAALSCGVVHHDPLGESIEGCIPADLEMFRVGEGWRADQATGGS
jgi:hypothetical protein